MEKRAFGIDISPRSHNGYTYQNHHDFVIVGVSDGMYILDHGRLSEQAMKAPVKLAYHYARSGVDRDAQMEAFLRAIEAYEYDGYILDFEKRNNIKSRSFASKGEYLLNEMSALAPSVLYSGRFVIQDWIFAFDQYWPRENPIHIAQYPYDELRYGPKWDILKNVVVSEKWQPVLPAGCDWLIWQFSADGNRRAGAEGLTGNTSVDLNVFNGTIEDMKAHFKVGQTQPPTGPSREEVINECIQALKELK